MTDRWRHLAEIHAAPPWLWSALVEAMLPNKDDQKGWTVEATQKQVGRFAKLQAPPEWVDATEFAESGNPGGPLVWLVPVKSEMC